MKKKVDRAWAFCAPLHFTTAIQDRKRRPVCDLHAGWRKDLHTEGAWYESERGDPDQSEIDRRRADVSFCDP